MPKPRYLSIKNIEKYQHYKQRNPPWIKLHASLLSDYEFCRLPDASKWHYIGLLILASRTDNVLPIDSLFLAQQISATDKIDLTQRFFKQHVLAHCKHDASAEQASCIAQSESETEERQSQRRGEGEAARPSGNGRRPFPPEFSFTREMREWANAEGCQEAGWEFDKFRDYHVGKGSQFKDWMAAWRNWVRKSIEIKEHRANGSVSKL